MSDLWRRAFELFRRHFILWLPSTCAALLILVVDRLERLGVRRLVLWLSTRHSVLGGEVVSTDPTEFQHRALMVAIPLGFCRQFLDVCLFVAALVMTAKLVGAILNEQRPEIADALRDAVSDWRRVLLLSFKLMLALGAMGGIMILSTSSALISNRLSQIVASKGFIYPVGLMLEGAVAWLLMPAAMRLLRGSNAASVSAECRRLGTIFMLLTSVAALALANIASRLEKGLIFDSRGEFWAISALNTIVANAPEVFFFIALTLLAADDTVGHRGIRPFRPRDLLQNLTPMHFEHGEDPE